MRLAIRWKLLLLLLTLTLLPLLALEVVSRQATRRLGRDLAEETRELIEDSAQAYLQTTVDHASRTLFREGQLLELALRVQVHEVEARLAAPPPDEPAIYLDRDFDRHATDGQGPTVPGIGPSVRHTSLDGEGRRRPMLVSFDAQVTRLAPGVSLDDVADDAARLADMAAVYRRLSQSCPDLIFWQYTSLASGVHTAYPGKGGYPADFDPRQRPWYAAAIDADGIRWAPPTLDVNTGQVILTLAAPVRRPDASVAGVTAIDISLADLLRRVSLPAPWRRDAVAMLLQLPGEDDADAPTVIVDQSEQAAQSTEWRRLPQAQRLAVDDPSQLQTVLADMRARQANVRSIDREGRAWLAAYGPIDRAGSYFMILVPRDVVAAPAARVEQAMLGRTWRGLHIAGAIGGVVVVLVVAVGILASRHISRPIARLADAAHRLASGDLETTVRIRTGDELQRLGEAFNQMAPRLRDAVKMRQSLALAMEVQQSLLPDAAPLVANVQIAGQSLYCDETGGDYYDFLTIERLSQGSVLVAVGDVAGHGVAAALLMATTRALIRTHLDEPRPLDQLVGRVNRHITTDRLPGKFVTLFCVVLDGPRRTATWVSAGHDPAIVYRPATDSFSQWEGKDIPLGIDANWSFQSCTAEPWQPGDIVVIGTDGIWETRNARNEPFGKDRLRDTIRANAHACADELAAAITASVRAFRDAGQQEDDVTLVVMKLA